VPRPPVSSLVLAGAFLLSAAPAHAFFHEWDIKEIYTNADGSMQYIELHCPVAGENFPNGVQIIATSDGMSRTFTFNSNLAGDTTNRHLLIASPGFASLAGAVAPDFTLPAGVFFDPEATSITIQIFGGFVIDSVTFAGASLPLNGRDSLTDTTIHTLNTTLVSGQSSPTNYSGTAGALPTDEIFLDGFEGTDAAPVTD
jgi:hypothetical protein